MRQWDGGSYVLSMHICMQVIHMQIYPSKNHLARNMQVLQVFFSQDLQDLALNLARLALK